MTITSTMLEPARVQRAEVLLAPEVVEDVAFELRRVKNHKQLELALLSGQLITERLYDGDPANLNSRDPRKAGLRALAAHPAVDVGASTLHAYVSVYALTLRISMAQARRDKLSYTHYRTVLGVPEEHQQELLERAADNDWTVMELQEEAKPLRPSRATTAAATNAASTGGAAKRVVKAFARTATSQRKTMESEELTQGLTKRRAARLAGEVDKVIAALEAMKARLEAVQDEEPETKPAPEPKPAPVPVPATQPSKKPKVAKRVTSQPKVATKSAPVARTATKPKARSQPVSSQTANTAGKVSRAEAALEADARASWEAVQRELAAGVAPERLARVLQAKTGVSAAFATRMALLSRLPNGLRAKLERWPSQRKAPTLAQILAAARLE